MTPRAESDVIGRHGQVYSHDVIGPPANISHERMEKDLRTTALSIVRGEASDDVDRLGLVTMANMEQTLSNIVSLHERLKPFVGISLEETTAEYLSIVTSKVIESDETEISAEDCSEFFTGLGQILPELDKSA